MKILNRDYRLIPVDRLIPHPANFNRGDLDIISESVQFNGFFGAVTVRNHPTEFASWEILAGEHRWRAAVAEGAPEVPCIIVDADDHVLAARILAVDNESAKRSSYDPVKLTDLLGFIGSTEGTAFDLAALEDFEEERAAAEPVEPEKHEPEYGVIVVCDDEAQQRELYDELKARGLQTRVATI